MRILATTLILNVLLWVIILATMVGLTEDKLDSMRWETTSPDQLRVLNRECFEWRGRSTVRVAVATQKEPRTYYITCEK